MLKTSPSFAGDSFAGEQAEAIYRRFALLSRASEILASSLDYEGTLRQIAWLVVPELADWCAIYLIQADGSARFGALAYANPGHMHLAQAFERLHPLMPARAQHVLRSEGSRLGRMCGHLGFLQFGHEGLRKMSLHLLRNLLR